jgi:hypothetical protein
VIIIKGRRLNDCIDQGQYRRSGGRYRKWTGWWQLCETPPPPHPRATLSQEKNHSFTTDLPTILMTLAMPPFWNSMASGLAFLLIDYIFPTFTFFLKGAARLFFNSALYVSYKQRHWDQHLGSIPRPDSPLPPPPTHWQRHSNANLFLEQRKLRKKSHQLHLNCFICDKTSSEV